MNVFVKILSTTIDSTKRRIIKVLRMGKSDVQTAFESMPYGIDSVPIKDMVAIFGPTAQIGKTVVFGYINKNQKAETGEIRLFSTNDDGIEQFYVWLKKNGTVEIGGDSNYAVKFNELKTEFNKLKSDYNAHITEYNLHTHIGVTVGTSASGITTPSTNTNTSNIDNAKNPKIKTI